MNCSFNYDNNKVRINLDDYSSHGRWFDFSNEYYENQPEKLNEEEEAFTKWIVRLYDASHIHVGKAIDETIVKQFNILAEKWEGETGLYSTITPKIINDAFYDLLLLGRDKGLVPLILKRIEQGAPAQWHIVLNAITKVQPVPDEYITNSKKIKEAWLAWGRKNNLI